MLTSTLSALPTVTTTDQVFDTLHGALISLELRPGEKISEAEIARQLGVSRQPVRDVFFRLSKLGFLQIRPQRATLVTKITEQDVRDAAFIRTAIECACIREAAQRITDQDLDALDQVIAQQRDAIETGQKRQFQKLDDLLHQRIVDISGHGHAWDLIQEQKAHIDRVRFLSLPFNLQPAFDQHCDIVACLRDRAPQRAEKVLCDHLERIHTIVRLVRDAHPEFFEDTA